VFWRIFASTDRLAIVIFSTRLSSPAHKVKVPDYSSPYQPSWLLARAAATESSRVRKQRFRDVLESCKQKVKAMEAMESPVAFQEGEDGLAVGDGSGAGAAAGGGAGAGGGSGGGADGMRLVQLLVACAEAVACRDRAQAAALLRELQAGAPVHGTAFQRVASCFVQGLADRLALAHLPVG